MVKVANNELYYKALNFYLDEHPDILTDLLEVLKPPEHIPVKRAVFHEITREAIEAAFPACA